MHRSFLNRYPCVAMAGVYAASRTIAFSGGETASALQVGAGLVVLLAALILHQKITASMVTFAVLTIFLGTWHGNGDRLDTTSGVPFEEGEIVGRILESPEPAASGETLLRVRSDGLHYRLKVRPSFECSERPFLSLRRGDKVRLWARTGLPAPFENPGTDSPVLSLRSSGIDRVGTVKSVLLVELIGSGNSGPLRLADQARCRMRKALDRIAGADREVRGLLGAMLLGDRGGLPVYTLDRLRDAGLVHLIAVSGLHVGLILLLVLFTSRRLAGPFSSPLITKLLVVSVLLVLIGTTPSILRAGSMALIAGWGRRFGRTGYPLNSLAAVGLLLVIMNPASLYNAGFQMSFAATAGILGGYLHLKRILPVPAFPGSPLAVSASAYLAAAPWSAALFGTLVPGSLVSNLVSAPLCGLILLAGYPAMILTSLGCPAVLSGKLATAGCRSLLRLAEMTPGPALQVPPPSLPVIFCLAAGVPVFWGYCRSRKLRSILMCVSFLGLTCLHLGKVPESLPAGTIEVMVPDVGQGQAVLVRAGGCTLLVDAGGSRSPTFDIGLRVVAPQLARLGIHRLDVLALSHEHLDHVGGAGAILKRFEVGELAIVPGTHASPAIRPLLELAWTRRIPVLLAGKGTTLRGEGWMLRSLHPGKEDQDLSVNNRSLVLRFETEDGSVLMPGDLETEGETSLTDDGLNKSLLDSNLLIAGHHGAADGSTLRFLEAVSPEVVLVSAGRNNRLGHPDPGTIERFRSVGATVASTGKDGLLTWRLNRSGWAVTGYRSGESAGTRQEK